jgi:hypothetical protein
MKVVHGDIGHLRRKITHAKVSGDARHGAERYPGDGSQGVAVGMPAKTPYHMALIR